MSKVIGIDEEQNFKYVKLFKNFSDYKVLSENYEVKTINGVERCINKKTKEDQTDKANPKLFQQLKLAEFWRSVAGISYQLDEPEESKGIGYAFNESAEELFYEVIDVIEDSINYDGKISTAWLNRIGEQSKYKHAQDIIQNITGRGADLQPASSNVNNEIGINNFFNDIMVPTTSSEYNDHKKKLEEKKAKIKQSGASLPDYFN